MFFGFLVFSWLEVAWVDDTSRIFVLVRNTDLNFFGVDIVVFVLACCSDLPFNSVALLIFFIEVVALDLRCFDIGTVFGLCVVKLDSNVTSAVVTRLNILLVLVSIPKDISLATVGVEYFVVVKDVIGVGNNLVVLAWR